MTREKSLISENRSPNYTTNNTIKTTVINAMQIQQIARSIDFFNFLDINLLAKK